MNAWLDRTYERYGERAMWIALGALIPWVGLGIVPMLAVFPALYLGLDFSEWLRVVVTADLVGGVAIVVALRRLPLRELRAWSAGERSAELAATAGWWAFAGPRRALLGACGGGMLLVVPVVVYTLLLPVENVGLVDIVEIGVGTVGAGIAAATGTYCITELLLQPVRSSLAAYSVKPRRRSFGLTGLLVASFLSLAYICTLGTGFMFVERGAEGGDMLVVAAAGVASTVFLGLAVLPLISANVLGPIAALTQGQRDVAAGNLETRVPVLTTDELGELADGFNTMVEGLRERDSLRGANVELVDELIASRSRIVAAADATRRRVERDLHDGAQQHLVLLNLKLGLLERAVQGNADALEQVAAARGDLDLALAELRDLAHGIYPQVLTSDGVPAALAEVAPQAELRAENIGRHAPELEAAVYFCCLEALQNAAKYAGEGATAIVSLAQTDSELRFEVADDGAGFDTAAANGSAGLQNMADRIGALGGEVKVESEPGEGTRVVGSVPVQSTR